MKGIKIGLIGCGKQAPKHLSGLQKIAGVEVVLADINPDLAKALASQVGVSWVASADEIFTDPDIAAVDICTPTTSHITLIKRAVEAGKDFLCEKPLCETALEAQELERLVKEHRRIGMVGFIYRFSPVFSEGKRLFTNVPVSGSSDVLGRIVTANFRIGGRGSHQLWKHRKEAGGGAINEMLVHMLDLAIWYFGPVSNCEVLVDELICATRQILGTEHEVDGEDFILVRLLMKNGIQVICQADLLTPAFSQYCEVQGENGTFMGSIQPDFPSFVFCSEASAEYQKGRTVLDNSPLNLFEVQMAEFVRAVRNQTQPGLCTVKDSMQLLGVLNSINERRTG